MKVSVLDVHKNTVFCAICNGESPGEIKEFSTVTASAREMGSLIRNIVHKQ